MRVQQELRLSLGFVTVLSCIVLMACGSETTPTPESSQTTTPAAVGVKYPVTVTDMLGRSVEFSRNPTRIVSISPTATEMLYRIGGTAVGRDTGSTFSPGVESLPTVGGAYNPSVEAIVALEPDLILIEAITQGHLSQALASVNASMIAVRATSVQDIEDGLALIGQVIDREEEARLAIAEIESRIKAVVDSTNVVQSVLILISDAERNLYAAMPESYPGAVASILGLSNIAEGLRDSGPYPGFTLFSAEQAITSNPDIILTISPAPEPAPRLATMLPMVPGFGSLPAVTKGSLHEVSADLLLTAPGPRIVDAIEEIAGLLNTAPPVY